MIPVDLDLLRRALPNAKFGAALASSGRVTTDSRDVQPGDVYVALIGERFDAHDFALAALENAGAVIVSRSIGDDTRSVIVDDTLVALQDIARAVIRQSGVRRIALTGSNGKTSTKELCAAALEACVPGGVHKTHGNLNNHVGVPLTAFALEPRHKLALFEMGMNHLGEIARLCEIVEPEIGLITQVGTAHAANLGGIDGVAKAKGEIFHGLVDGGVAIVNADDTRVVQQARAANCKHTITFGTAPSDVRLLSHTPHASSGSHVTFEVRGEEIEAHVPLDGAHNAVNAAAALAICVALELDIATAAAGLANAEGISGRLRRVQALSGALILDDTYNANPDSMRAGFATLAAVAGERRRVVALGEMKEVERAANAHREMGAAAVDAGVTRLFACGTDGQRYVEGALRAGLDDEHVTWAADAAALAPLVAQELSKNDALLVKGSRSAEMERVVHALVAEGNR